MTLSELILMLRTYTIWERKRAVLIFFIGLAVVILIPAIVFTAKEAESLSFKSDNGCQYVTAGTIIFLAYCLLTVYETTVVIFIVIKAIEHLRQTRSPWVTKLYKDGILFYLYLLVLSCGNIVSSLVAPQFGPWLISPQRVIHSILCTRVLLLILQRNRVKATSETQTSTAIELDVIGEDSELPIFTLTGVELT
jgi:hypothetical protein